MVCIETLFKFKLASSYHDAAKIIVAHRKRRGNKNCGAADTLWMDVPSQTQRLALSELNVGALIIEFNYSIK